MVQHESMKMKDSFKKLCIMCICVLLAVLASACSAKKSAVEPETEGTAGEDLQDSDEKLVKAGLEAAGHMKEYTCSDFYRNIMSSTLYESDMVDVVKGEDVTKPKAIYEISVDPMQYLSEMMAVASAETGEDSYRIENLSDVLKKRLADTSYASLPNMINTKSGASAVAFTAMFNDSGNMIFHSLKERRIFVYVFESGYPVWVTFIPGNDDIVSYSAQWVIMDSEKIGSEDDLISESGLDLLPTITVKKLK